MDIKPIKTDADLQNTLKRLDEILFSEAGTPEFDELEILSTLIEAYENKHYPIECVDPIEAIRFRMEQMGLSNAELLPIFGTKGRVWEVMNKKRNLSIGMIIKLNLQLKIPFESLLLDRVMDEKSAKPKA